MTDRINFSVFRKFERLINVYFYTSNTEKFLQALTLFSRYGYPLRHYAAGREPYEEEYGLGTRHLLESAISQLRNELGLRSPFFVEDTSLRIECLSDEATDYPGLSVKEWFENVTFEELDQQIRLRSGDRRVIVKSDIGLHLPNLERPIFFHGETEGELAKSAPHFDPSPQYPWLTPYTFNGWFIPNGAQNRLGEMEFEESIEYDFRIKSLTGVLERLKEFCTAINLPSTAHTRRQRFSQIQQYSLLSSENAVVCVLGHKCAGKSTLGDYLSRAPDVHWVEASSIFMDIKRRENDEAISRLDTKEYMKHKGRDIVAKEILSTFMSEDENITLITGLRTIEEMEFLVSGLENVIVAFISTDPRIRYNRHIKRARDVEVGTYKDFLEGDADQLDFGLLRVAEEISDVVIFNNGTLDEYHRKLENLISDIRRGYFLNKKALNSRERVLNGELYRTLLALDRLGRAATCEDISKQTEVLGQVVRIYNTNRALKNAPELAHRVERKGHKLKYKIDGAGRSYLRMVRKYFEVDGTEK